MAASPPNVSDSTLLAVDRTRLAHERTLMAWVRTATSMISFGFAIAKLVPNRGMRALRVHYPDDVPYSNAMLVALLVAGFGLLASSRC